MAEVSVTVRGERVGEIETGIWCDGCMLPARVGALIALQVGNGPVTVGYYSQCENGCGPRG